MSTEKYDRIAEILAEANRRFPNDAFVDRRRLNGLLSDHVGDAESEIRIVLNAIQDGAVDELKRAPDAELPVQIGRLVSKLENAWGLKPEIAKRVIMACAYGIGRGGLPSKFTAQAPAPNQNDAWVGMTEFANPGPQAEVQQSGRESKATTTGSSLQQSLQDWFRKNQKIALGGVGAAIAALYFIGSSAPPQPVQPQAPIAPVAGPGAPTPNMPAPNAPMPRGAQPNIPQPNQPSQPGMPGPASPQPMPQPGQNQGQPMAWFDDNGGRFDVIVKANGEFTGRGVLPANVQNFTMKGESNNGQFSFKVFNGQGKHTSNGVGYQSDQTHLVLQMSAVDGRQLYSGKIHINHEPGK